MFVHIPILNPAQQSAVGGTFHACYPPLFSKCVLLRYKVILINTDALAVIEIKIHMQGNNGEMCCAVLHAYGNIIFILNSLTTCAKTIQYNTIQ